MREGERMERDGERGRDGERMERDGEMEREWRENGERWREVGRDTDNKKGIRVKMVMRIEDREKERERDKEIQSRE